MHSCPECGQACYCNGDIDDIELPGSDEETYCCHCPIGGWPDPEDVEPWELDRREREGK